jgi:hypothetical protein
LNPNCMDHCHGLTAVRSTILSSDHMPLTGGLVA